MRQLRYAFSLGLALLGATTAVAQDRVRSVNTYGVPGIVDMPNAYMQPDAEISSNLAYFGGDGRLSLAFQITPRLQGVFRYATLGEFRGPGTPRNYDRSFDLRYQLLTETSLRPAVTVGLQDFGGTGIYSAEYVVATKSFFDRRLSVTGGIGWGRLATKGGFSNPLGQLSSRFDKRSRGIVGTGGQFSTGQWFRGPAALFGGVSYQATDRLTLKAEYSSDAYLHETTNGIFTYKTPVNIGASYQITPNANISAYTLLGSEIGLNFTYTLNPKRPSAGGSGVGPAPQPVAVRPSVQSNPAAWSQDWVADPASAITLEANIQQVINAADLVLDSYKLGATEVEVRFRNPRYQSQAQAIGRAARGLTLALPASVEHFVLVPINEGGIAGAAIRLSRSDIEELETAPDGAWQSYVRADIFDAAHLSDGGLRTPEDRFPAATWGLSPYIATSLFDPDSPVRLDLGLELSGRYEPTPGLILSGAIRQPIVGNRDSATRLNNSILPHVRSDANQFAKADGPVISYLTGEYFFRPAEGLYGRVTAGLLEQMYGGVSAELLWRPADSRLALGVELNQVRLRDFDQQFGFQNYEITTGHVSAYYQHQNGFYSQLDVGRYLAGDDGATYTLMREFNNGWRVGGYFTLTDVSSVEFGEGSFDKGIRVEIPLDWALGRPTRTTAPLLIQPVLRDGGARLSVRNRLYDLTRDQVTPDLGDDWARVWR